MFKPAHLVLLTLLAALPRVWADGGNSTKDPTNDLFAIFLHPRCLSCHAFYANTKERQGLRWVAEDSNRSGHLGRLGDPAKLKLPEHDPAAPARLQNLPEEERKRRLRMLEEIRLFKADRSRCAACHADIVKEWLAPGSELDWTGLTPKKICRQVAENFLSTEIAEVDSGGPGGSPQSPHVKRLTAAEQGELARDHLKKDSRVLWALRDGRLPEDATAEKPKVSLEDWFRMVDAWVDGGMKCE